MENQEVEMIGRRPCTGMRIDESGFNRGSYDCTWLDMS